MSTVRKRIDGGWYRVDVIGIKHGHGETFVTLDEASMEIVTRRSLGYWYWYIRALFFILLRRA